MIKFFHNYKILPALSICQSAKLYTICFFSEIFDDFRILAL